jgi:hypothetical protein
VVMQVVLACFGYMMVCFMFNMLDELFPIFAAAPLSMGGVVPTAQHQPSRCTLRSCLIHSYLGRSVVRPWQIKVVMHHCH